MKNNLFILGILLVLNFIFISAGELKVTQEHPFLINGSWIDASQLKVGDELTLANGSKVKITKLTDVVANESFKVYNLEAGEYHNFVVGEEGVVVHNSNVAVVPHSGLARWASDRASELSRGSAYSIGKQMTAVNPAYSIGKQTTAARIQDLLNAPSQKVDLVNNQVVVHDLPIVIYDLPSSKTVSEITLESIRGSAKSALHPSKLGVYKGDVIFFDDKTPLLEAFDSLDGVPTSTPLVVKVAGYTKTYSTGDLDVSLDWKRRMSFESEILSSKALNAAGKQNGLEDIVSPIYVVKTPARGEFLDLSSEGDFMQDAVMVQKAIDGSTVDGFVRGIGLDSISKIPADNEMATALKKLVSSQIDSYYTKLYDSYKTAGWVFDDMHKSNLVINFKSLSLNKKFTVLELKAMPPNIWPADLEFYITSYESGGGVFKGAGNGGFVPSFAPGDRGYMALAEAVKK